MKLWFLIIFSAILSSVVSAQEPAGDSVVEPQTFESQVDLSPFNEVAVWQDGRIKSWESFSRSMMQFVSGSRKIDGQSPAFTYLDMAQARGLCRQTHRLRQEEADACGNHSGIDWQGSPCICYG